ALLSGAAVYLSARLALRISGSVASSWASALLVATTPLHLRLGLSPLSEPLYLVLLLLFLLALERRNYGAAVVATFFMEAVRFNAWPIGLVLGIFLLWRNSEKTKWFGALGAAAFPIFWFSYCWVKSGDPLLSIHYHIQDALDFASVAHVSEGSILL